MKDITFEILKTLVESLESTYWSSWQSTAKFQDALDVAREHLNERKDYGNDD